MSMKKKNRRALLTGAVATAAAASAAQAQSGPVKKIHRRGPAPKRTPLFNPAVSYGNLLFISGKGAHFKGDIKAHTDHVLKELEKELKKHGSSMEKVLKVNVYLHDLNDYKAMNEVYRGRFGEHPPVRTTVACHAGIPGDSLVEIDCIAALD